MRRAGNPGAPAPGRCPRSPAGRRRATAARPARSPRSRDPLPRRQSRPTCLPRRRPLRRPPAPTFSTPSTAGQSIAEAANAAARNHGSGGEGGLNAPLRHPGLQSGAEILSDTQNVDFGPYMKQLRRLIIASWYPLIPEECEPPLNKEGQTMIRFTIQPNGVVSAMHLDGSTHDIAIDKAAWGGITGVGQFPPLPKEFHGDNLQLRVTFVISHDRSQAE